MAKDLGDRYRVRRLREKLPNGQSLYVVERRMSDPLTRWLGAIYPWDVVGYVGGKRGDWFGFDQDPSDMYLGRSRREKGTMRRKRAYVPPLTGSRSRTVEEAAMVVKREAERRSG